MNEETTIETVNHSRQSCKHYYKKILILDTIHKEIQPAIDKKRQAEYVLFFWREDRPMPLSKVMSNIFIDIF